MVSTKVREKAIRPKTSLTCVQSLQRLTKLHVQVFATNESTT
jgi:hypothetical protein